jgi:hypothetical protein
MTPHHTHRTKLRALTHAGVLLLAIVAGIPGTSAAVYGGGGLVGGLSLASGLGGIVGATTLADLIIKIVTFILDFILLLAVVAIIVAGVYLITSGGEEGQKDKAKKIIIYAIVGVIVAILSRAIVIFVNHLF